MGMRITSIFLWMAMTPTSLILLPPTSNPVVGCIVSACLNGTACSIGCAFIALRIAFFHEASDPKCFGCMNGKKIMKNHVKNLTLVVLVLLIIALADPNRVSLIVGGFLIFSGQLIRLWATGHLRRDKEVTTSGPYAYVRDPLYLGRLFLLIGFCVAAWGYSLYVLIPGLALFFLDYMPRKQRKEMARLEKLFGESYRRYASVTHSLLPGTTRYYGAQNRAWSFQLMWYENREQYFLIGVGLISLAVVFNLNVVLLNLFGT